MKRPFERIFQDCDGKVVALNGLTLSGLKCLYVTKNDLLTDKVILLWLKILHEDLWLRIFIDGIYCGIDKFFEDESKQDEDDWVTFVNYDSWVNNLTIKEAFVFSNKNFEEKFIRLEILLSNESKIELASIGEDEKCSLILRN